MDNLNIDAEDHDHVGSSSLHTPLREDAFKLTDDVKIELIEKHFREIMHVLGLEGYGTTHHSV